MADAPHLFAWRNDALTRAMSRNTEAVRWADHLAWLESSLASSARDLLIIERNDEPVATCRYDYGGYDEWSWTIAPEMRGKGLSLKIAKLGLSVAQRPVLGFVKRENLATLRLIAAAGFVKLADGPIEVWRHTPSDLFEGRAGRTRAASERGRAALR
jgi:RimJ/RimL family protein N-acetyltransferase